MKKLELISVHIPKTAGTSLHLSLSKHYGDDFYTDHLVSTYPNWAYTPEYNTLYPAPLPSNTRAVHGHFRADRYAGHRDAFLMVWLRDPVERIISNYFFWLSPKFPGERKFEKEGTERPSLLSFAERGLGFYEALVDCVDMKRYNFVGFCDRRNSDLKKLAKLTGISFDSNSYLNQTAPNPERVEVQNDIKLLSKLRDVTASEYAVYDRFREAWD